MRIKYKRYLTSWRSNLNGIQRLTLKMLIPGDWKNIIGKLVSLSWNRDNLYFVWYNYSNLVIFSQFMLTTTAKFLFTNDYLVPLFEYQDRLTVIEDLTILNPLPTTFLIRLVFPSKTSMHRFSFNFLPSAPYICCR